MAVADTRREDMQYLREKNVKAVPEKERKQMLWGKQPSLLRTYLDEAGRENLIYPHSVKTCEWHKGGIWTHIQDIMQQCGEKSQMSMNYHIGGAERTDPNLARVRAERDFRIDQKKHHFEQIVERFIHDARFRENMRRRFDRQNFKVRYPGASTIPDELLSLPASSVAGTRPAKRTMRKATSEAQLPPAPPAEEKLERASSHLSLDGFFEERAAETEAGSTKRKLVLHNKKKLYEVLRKEARKVLADIFQKEPALVQELAK